MRTKKNHVVAVVSASAATLLLSGAVAMASETGAASTAKADASAHIATMKSGKIIPVNLLSAHATTSGYSFDNAATDCCGPYSQCDCPNFRNTE